MPSLMGESLSLSPGSKVACRLRADDLIEIVAWLEFCISRNKPFKQTVIQHLSRTRQKDFSWKQIDDKFNNWWKYHPRYSLDNVDHLSIYRRGIKALGVLAFDEGTRKAIHERVQQLLKEYDQAGRSPNKKLRRKRRGRKSGSGHLKNRHALRQISDTVEVYLPSREGQDVQALQTQPSNAAPAYLSRQSSATISPIPDSEDPENSGSPDFKPEIFLSSPNEGHSGYRDSGVDCSGSHGEGESSFDACIQCETKRQLLEDRDKDLQYVRSQLSTALQANVELTHQLEGAGHNRAIWLKQGDESPERLLQHYLTRIEELTCELRNKEALCPFTTRSLDKHLPFDPKYFQDTMLDIKIELDDLLVCAETLQPCEDVEIDTLGEDLGMLARRATTQSSKLVPVGCFQFLAQSLISAAICEWVFETRVDEPVFATSPLRETMLSHLQIQDGEEVARNLDFAAHHELIEGTYYQDELIPRRAKALALRVSEMMRSLLSMQKRQGRWEVDILGIWTSQRKRLEKIFTSALRIKARALICKDIFEVIFPSPGDSFDDVLMKGEKSEAGEQRDRRPCVQLCLLPGLRKFPFDRKLVDYNSFRRPHRDTADASDLIARAVVLIH